MSRAASLTIIYGSERVTLSVDQPMDDFRANQIRARDLFAKVLADRAMAKSSERKGFESQTDQGG